MSEQIDLSITRKYNILNKLGKGEYGIVWKAIEKKSQETVAIKKVFDAFQNSTYAQSIFREIMFLQELSHENIIRLLNVIRAENDKDIYLVFEFMETDLHSSVRGNILEPIHKKYIIYQVLRALKYMHSGLVIHRDLKPANILLNSECLIKLTDFGMARSISAQREGLNPLLTDYVASRWYRAPEVLLGACNYSKAIDMWSVGCILAEMISGKVLFPGTSTLNQLDRIMEITGRPTIEDLNDIPPAMISMLENLNSNKNRELIVLLGTSDLDAVDLVSKLLQFSPKKRLSVEEALEHPFVSDFHDSEEEMSCPYTIRIALDDNVKLSIKEYRDRIYQDIFRRKKELRRRQFLNRGYS
ncbi:hypothetical protein SteCoe_35001 [Stentor coeruleus]|uniref:Mitogen-activated protein kinase n=1 Tax=Stentor coeruleus TaxID=5963 RepID=A0A1R2ATM1_9CILI|nr:hypothetical protein SteCoe_35001 [Stentor coeruleus]